MVEWMKLFLSIAGIMVVVVMAIGVGLLALVILDDIAETRPWVYPVAWIIIILVVATSIFYAGGSRATW